MVLIVNKCINMEQLLTDGHVASVLCVGGPVKHKLKPGSNVTHQFLMDVVVPGIAKHYSNDENNKIASALALPLLCSAHHPGLEHMMSNLI